MEGQKNIIRYIKKNFKDKKFLFIENDVDLYRELNVLENILIDNKIKYHTLFNLSEMSLKGILGVIDFADVVVWQSTYSTEISRQLLALIDKYPDKIFIECPINEPLYYYKQDISDFYVLNVINLEGYENSWTFHKLSDKPLWEKGKNEI